ncbi:MAG: site-specific integrase [Nitrospira sp. BO4]|jgi:integrase|nr:site-specific integrase [Nitrospira sp. BO4]
MGLTKRKDSYYVEFHVIDDGKTLTLASSMAGAKLKRWKVGCTSKAIAKQQEAVIRTQLLAKTMPSQQVQHTVTTFAQWAEQYMQIEEVKRIRSYRERCQRITKRLVPAFGQKLLRDLTVQDVEQYRRERAAYRALATVNVDHQILRHMLKHAMRRDLIVRNVASLVVEPKPDNARDRVLEPEEWTRLYTGAPEWFKPILLTGYHTGMRLEEILTLEWDRVDLEKNRLFLPKQLTKTNRERYVPLTPTLRRELQRLRIQDGVIRIQGLVYQKGGKKINHTYREVQRICQEQQIDNFVFHDLRHCAATNLADAGVEAETIMAITGHRSVEMYLRYRSVKPERLDDAMTRLDAAVNTVITPASRQASKSI